MDIYTIDENLFSLKLENEKDFMIDDCKDIKKKEIDQLLNKTLSLFTALHKVESVKIIH